jgi:hypothetical protein
VILTVVAIPCENLSIDVANDRREPAVIQIAVRQFYATPAQVVWTGTVKGGETRAIPLIVAPGDYKVHVVAQFPDSRDLNFVQIGENSGGYLFGIQKYGFRLSDKSLLPKNSLPEPSSMSKPNIFSLPVIVAELLHNITRCQDYELRRGFRRWIAEPPFSLKSGGGAG